MTHGQRLADGLMAYVEAFRASAAGAATASESRLLSDRRAGAFASDPPPELERFTSFLVASGQEIALRIHRPRAAGRVPAIVYCHGGGFVAGSIESFDSVAQGLAAHCGALVVSVQYRRLPENRYADAAGDCAAALGWTFAHAAALDADPAAVAIAGDSVGALLALSAARTARDAGGPIPFAQMLFYGAYSMLPGRPCYARGADPLLTADRVEAVAAAFRAAGGTTPDHAPAALAGLPPSLLVAAEHDPLCPETIELASALAEAGVAIAHRVAPGMIHGFLRAGRFAPAVGREWHAIGAWFARTHSQFSSKDAA